MTEDELLKIMRAQEDQLRWQRYESSYFWDRQGNLLFRKNGEVDRITFNDEEIIRMRGAAATHNHPHGWNYSVRDPRRAGYTFSKQDMRLACLASLLFLRVVTPRFRYMMKPPAQGWDLVYWETILQPIYQRVYGMMRTELRAKVQGRQVLQAEAEMQFRHLIWERVAAELGLGYS